jgi:hypothetical protein
VEAAGHEFEPFNIENREAVIAALPSSPLALFQQFIPKILVEKWVKYTNDAAAATDTAVEVPPSSSESSD